VLSALEALRERDAELELLYVGSERGPEGALAREAGLEFKSIRTGKFRRYGQGWWRDPAQLWANLKDAASFKIGVIQAFFIIRRFRPDVVLAKGGYVSLPVGIAAWCARVPLVIHETDLVMGLANRILARFATRVAVPRARHGASSTDASDPRWVETGQPLRKELFSSSEHRFFAGDDDLPVLLVVGGSQGARPLNRVVFQALPELLPQVRIIHLTGTADAAEAVERALVLPAQYQARYVTHSFLSDEYPSAIQTADIVLTRAGGTLWEVAALGKCAIIVPLPHSAGDHQRANARAFQSSGAGIVIEQLDLDAERLVREVGELLKNPDRRREVGVRARELAHPDAAGRLAQVVMEAGQRRGG
jgi:UDP-N-acetylglucosamine--N-acetylmuramyl-(pentapeptide) pyrophosphoryl-undecaprenol N-acetylglucosamine transferase